MCPTILSNFGGNTTTHIIPKTIAYYLLELDVKIHGIFLYEFFSSILLGFCR
jgi:hypothetical protein